MINILNCCCPRKGSMHTVCVNDLWLICPRREGVMVTDLTNLEEYTVLHLQTGHQPSTLR